MGTLLIYTPFINILLKYDKLINCPNFRRLIVRFNLKSNEIGAKV